MRERRGDKGKGRFRRTRKRRMGNEEKSEDWKEEEK